MWDSHPSNAEKIYINEIIRVTYKCNWKCKFCNVFKTNNYGDQDVTDNEVVYQILHLTKKYTLEQRKNLILSFSGGEPTLDPNLLQYIRLAKKIGVKVVEIQTNGTRLFKEKEYIHKLIEAWLSEIFLAQHSGDEEVNRSLGSYFKISDFQDWTKYILENEIHKKICIYLNIVVTKINLFHVHDYIQTLYDIWFIQMIPKRGHDDGRLTSKISFGLVQPNGYAELNKHEVLLDYNQQQVDEVEKIIKLCEKLNILPDFHFVCPPLCVLNYPEYNLEHSRLKKLEQDTLNGTVNQWNLQSYEFLWKEKMKFSECKKCPHDKYCLWFYKNWVSFVWEEHARKKIEKFLSN